MRTFVYVLYSLVFSTLCGNMTGLFAEAPQWNAWLSNGGTIQIEHEGKSLASLIPGLFEADWKFAEMSDAKAGQTPSETNLRRGKIVAPGGGVVDVQLRIDSQAHGARLEYQLTPQSNMRLNSLHVTLKMPCHAWAGGSINVDGTSKPLPRKFANASVHSGNVQSLAVSSPAGATLQLQFESGTPLLVQDDRQWGETFSLRLGPQTGSDEVWPAAKSLTITFDLSAASGLQLVSDGPVTIQAGPDWLPLDVRLDIEPGSALDFSQVIPRHAPAGKYGQLLVNSDGKFAFEDQADQSQRFYGVNLCFSAHYLRHEVADQLAERLWRLGYNALRIHHYERDLVDRNSGDRIQLKAEQLDQLDYLFAALKQRGIYLSTDLFVSRPVSKAKIYPGQSGDMGMDEYKMAVPVNDRANRDFQEFTKVLLQHVNPYTQMRYADDPALAWLSLVNENNPGNFIGRLEGPLKTDWQTAWNRWLASRFNDRASLVAAIGKLPDDQSPAKANVPLQDVHGSSPAAVLFNVFLAETQSDFFERTRRFLREELGCKALLTDMNAWTNPVQLQAVRGSFDYVDDHFYVDHPRFLERPWSLPSSCPNTSPIAEGALGGRACAFTRLYGKPFTISEFNYSSPGRFRGVGGILTGALGALQDWDGVWRFAYAHNRDNVAEPGPLNYFDVSADPLNQAAERASLCLFLRGDIEKAVSSVSIIATRDQLLDSPTTSRSKTPSWHGMAWLTRVGWTLDSSDRESTPNQLSLPLVGGKVDPFASETADLLHAELRKRGWLDQSNRTDLSLNRFQSDNGNVTIDAPENTLVLDTTRTAGGFAPAGKSIETKSASIAIRGTDATVWISSLDGSAIDRSKRLLITHLTDLQNSGARYADRRRQVLLAWGGLPHLVQSGSAEVSLRIQNPSAAKVYGLSTSGKRLGEVACTSRSGELLIPLSVDDHGKARILYEVEVAE